MKIVFISLIICFLGGCYPRQTHNNIYEEEGLLSVFTLDEIPVIDLEAAIASATDYYYLSDIAKRIEYIPLEFTPENAIGRVAQVFFTNEDIFILRMGSEATICRFDKTGNFLNIIGNIGRGPGEYLGALYFTVDTTKQHVYINSNWMPNIRVYDYNGQYIRTIMKDYTYTAEFYYFSETSLLANIGSVINIQEPNSFFLSIADTGNNIIYSKKYLLSSMVSPDQTVFGYSSVFKSDNRLLLTEKMNDTIFSFNGSFLEPFLIIDKGRYKMPLDAVLSQGRGNNEAFDPYASYISIFTETPQYIFLTFLLRQKLYLLRFDKHNHRYTTYITTRQEGMPVNTIHNDIDGGLHVISRIIPRYNQLARIIHPYDMKEELTPENFSNTKAKDMEAKERLKHLVQALRDEDNPVIMKIILK